MGYDHRWRKYNQGATKYSNLSSKEWYKSTECPPKSWTLAFKYKIYKDSQREQFHIDYTSEM